MNFSTLKQPEITDFVPATVQNDPNTMVFSDYQRLKLLQEKETDLLKNKIGELEKQLETERQRNRDLELRHIEASIEKKYLEKENESKSGLGSLASPEVLGTIISSLPQIIDSFKSTPQLSDDEQKLTSWYKNLSAEQQKVFHLFRNVLKDNPLQTVEQTLYKIKVQQFKTNNNVNPNNPNTATE